MARKHSKKLEKLILACREGDNRAWHILVDYLGPLIFSICKRARLSRDEGLDIYGQVCYELVRSIHSLQSPGKIRSFVATITRRRIYKLYKHMRIVEDIDESVKRELCSNGPGNPDEAYDQIRKRAIILEAMSHLSARDSDLLTALFLDPDEPSYKEISARLGMPVSSIGPTRAKALEKLYRILKRRNIGF